MILKVKQLELKLHFHLKERVKVKVRLRGKSGTVIIFGQRAARMHIFLFFSFLELYKLDPYQSIQQQKQST